LFNRNFIIDLLYINRIDENFENNCQILKNKINKVYKLDLNINTSYFHFFSSVFKLRKILSRENYDLIESSSVSGSILVCWANRLIFPNSTNLIIGLHFCKNHPSFGKLRDFILKWSLRICEPTVIYGVSNSVVKSFSNYKLCKPIRKIENSIGQEFFDENLYAGKTRFLKKYGIELNAKIVLYVGRIDKYKGIQDLFLSIVPLLNQNTYLILIGHIDSNAENLLNNFKAMLQKLDKLKYFIMFSHSSEISIFMRCSDVLVLPTYSEAFGLVLIESLASGLPIVTTTVDSIPELLKDTNSILIHPGKPDLLRESINTALNLTIEEKIKIREKGILVAKKFTIEKRVDKILSLVKITAG
jgi:glycosyltransferase involved in cell wall biosynthesis